MTYLAFLLPTDKRKHLAVIDNPVVFTDDDDDDDDDNDDDNNNVDFDDDDNGDNNIMHNEYTVLTEHRCIKFRRLQFL